MIFVKFQVIVAFFFVALFLFFIIAPTDPDLGWHLRCGKNFWLEGSFCSQNQFSVILEDYSWTNHAWGYQAVIFLIFKIGGFWGLSLFNAIVMTISFFLFYLSIKNYQFEKMLSIVLIILFGWGVFSFGIRSQLVGFLFFALAIFLFSKTKQNKNLIFVFPFLMLIWANVHGSVIIGLVLLGFFCLRKIISRPSDFLEPIIVLIVSILMTLANPFGLNIYRESWRHFAVVELGKLIAEWTPPNGPVYVLVSISGLCLMFFCLKNPGLKYKIFSVLIAGFMFLSLQAKRSVPLYFMLAFFVLFELPRTKEIFEKWLANDLRKKLALILTIALLVVAVFIYLPANIKANSGWNDLCEKSLDRGLNYPCGAVGFLKNQPPGNIFNAYEWGGFLIWQLPDFKVFVDGRMPAWPTESGKSPYTIYLETIQVRPGWQKTLEKYNISYLLIGPGTFMDLELDKGWEEVYRDNVSVVYKK